MQKFFNRVETVLPKSNIFHYLTIAFIALYTISAIIVSVNRFWQYQNFYFDFGIFDMAIWKMSRFQLPFVDHVSFGLQNILIFGDHLNPSLFLLAPFYWLTDRSEIILVAQSLAVGVSAYVGYLIARKQLKNKVAVFSLIVSYLLYVGLQNAIITDFHEVTVAILPLMVIFYTYFARKWPLFFLGLLVFLGFKETLSLTGVALGLFIFLRNKKDWKVSLLTIALSLFWGLFAYKFLIPHFSGGSYLYQPKLLPENLGQLLNRFVEPPLKIRTVFYSYLSFGLVPLFDFSIFPAIFDNFFERFILTEGKGNDLGMHYNALLTPFFFIGTLYVYKLLEKSKKLSKFLTPYSLFVIVLSVFLHQFILRGPLALAYNKDFYKLKENVTYQDDFISQIPTDGVIMTQNDIAVRFTHYNVKLLRTNYMGIDPDYIALNLTSGQNPNSFTPLTLDETVKLKEDLLNNKNYTLKKFSDEQYLFIKINKQNDTN